MRTFAVLLIGIAALTGCRQSAPSPAPTAASAETDATGTVTFQFTEGEEVTTFDVENVPDGATLESVMRGIDQLPISIRGSGVTAFVDQIGDTATSGSEGWTYEIDGEFATRGIGETTLSPPTRVEWKFGEMSEP